MADRNRAALHLLDWLGCVLVGLDQPEGRMLTAMNGADPFALAAGAHPGMTGQVAAAFGPMGSLLEMDDVHKKALLHPGPVVNAAIAGMGRGDPLHALVMGYEAMIRLGRSVGAGHYARFHNAATCGGLGAAVAASASMGLSPAQTVDAIGLALSLAGGLWQCRNEPVPTKHLHVAEAARRGVEAARYAGAGLRGPQYILEGPQGFFNGLAPDGDPALVIAASEEWLIHEVSFKPWPACRHAHAAIDAALALRPRLTAAPRDILIESYRDAMVFCDRAEPRTAGEARFSLQHAVAVALRDGPPAVGSFEPEAFAGYADLRALCRAAEAPVFTAAYPARFGARVTVTCIDGQVLVSDAPDAWGDPENPMDAAAVTAKFRSLAAAAGLAAAVIDDAASAILDLPANPDATALPRVLRRIAAALPQRIG